MRELTKTVWAESYLRESTTVVRVHLATRMGVRRHFSKGDKRNSIKLNT